MENIAVVWKLESIIHMKIPTIGSQANVPDELLSVWIIVIYIYGLIQNSSISSHPTDLSRTNLPRSEKRKKETPGSWLGVPAVKIIGNVVQLFTNFGVFSVVYFTRIDRSSCSIKVLGKFNPKPKGTRTRAHSKALDCTTFGVFQHLTQAIKRDPKIDETMFSFDIFSGS